MQELLLEVHAAEPTTVLLVTHDVEEAIFLADRVVVLSHRPGTIVHEEQVSLPRPRHREMVTAAYEERTVPVTLADGRRVTALTYVMRRDHWQYAGDMSAPEQATIIAAAQGGRGANADYLFNTVAHLDQLGLPDAGMADLADRVRAILTERARNPVSGPGPGPTASSESDAERPLSHGVPIPRSA